MLTNSFKCQSSTIWDEDHHVTKNLVVVKFVQMVFVLMHGMRFIYVQVSPKSIWSYHPMLSTPSMWKISSMISNLSTSFLHYDVIHVISFVHMLNSSTLLSLPNMVAYFTKPPLFQNLTLAMEVGTYHR